MIVDNGNEWFSKTTAVIRNMHFLDWNFWMRYMFNFLWLLQLQFSLSSAPKLLYTVIHTVFNKNQINKEQHGTYKWYNISGLGSQVQAQSWVWLSCMTSIFEYTNVVPGSGQSHTT